MDTNLVSWEEMADYYDAKQGDEGDLWHRTLIDPTVLRVLGPVAGQRVLDLACGNGYLSRRLARMGARVVGVDASAPIVARALERERRDGLGIAYHVADAARLTMLDRGHFDAVLCNMAIMDILDADGALREARRVLRPGGRFVASLPHPCFYTAGASAWVVERTGPRTAVWRKVGRYREVFEDQDHWRMGPDRYVSTRHYHRPLSWYFRALRAAGFAVTALEEPEPTEEFLREDGEGVWIQQVPLHCVLEALKLT